MILGDPKGRGRGRPPKPYQTSTIRQFDGGWNVIDTELNLSPKYAVIFDNVVRGADGSVSLRYGNKLWADLKLGTETTLNMPSTVVISASANSRVLNFQWTAHGFATGNHLSIPAFNFATVTAGDPDIGSKTYVVRVIDANNFQIVATSPVGGSPFSKQPLTTYQVKKDTHLAGGNIINGVYYDNRLILATQAGEIISVNENKTATRIWDMNTAYALPGTPEGWSWTTYAIFNPFGGKLQVHNGNDKPIEIDFKLNPVVQFIGDPASAGSNAFVPIGDVVGSNAGYNVIAGIKNKTNTLSLSAHLSPGVYTGNPAPDDALEVDIGKVTSATNPVPIGMAELRGKLIVALRDSLIIGTLGITHEQTVGSVTSNVHEPDFKDSIPQHGAISQRTMVGLGNDLFMCDRVGVPSVAQSQQSGQLIPNRVSKLIGPAIQLNLSRLSDATLKRDAFAVYNMRDSQYMLFLPKYDELDVRFLPENPVTFLLSLGRDTFLLTVPAHGFEVNDQIIISGATSVSGNLAANINGTWKIDAVIDSDTIMIKNEGFTYPSTNVVGGGSSCTVKPISDERIGYVLKYDPEMRIRAWSRFKGLNFTWGARSLLGRMFFGQGGKIYEFGTPEHPYSADFIDDYDSRSWAASTAYAKGYRILYNNVVYEAVDAHTSSGAANMGAEMAAFPDRWTVYKGRAIKFTWEWPWADFDTRLEIKDVRNVFIDATGKGAFNFNVFVDQLYKDPSNGALTPARSMQFVAADAGGYGSGVLTYGMGRRVREQLIWPIGVLGMLHKFRIEGETTDPIRFVAVTVVYNRGTMKR